MWDTCLKSTWVCLLSCIPNKGKAVKDDGIRGFEQIQIVAVRDDGGIGAGNPKYLYSHRKFVSAFLIWHTGFSAQDGLYDKFNVICVASGQIKQLLCIGEEGSEIDDGQRIYGIVRRPDNAV